MVKNKYSSQSNILNRCDVDWQSGNAAVYICLLTNLADVRENVSSMRARVTPSGMLSWRQSYFKDYIIVFKLYVCYL